MALNILLVVILSMLPISELRGAIPYGIAAGINPIYVYFVAVISNIALIPILFFFLDYVHHHLLPMPIYKKLFNAFVGRARHKVEKYTTKYGLIGLMLFVAIPLPVTGAYTGTLAAWILGLDKRKSIAALSAGVIIAGLIVTAVVLSGAGIGIFVSSRLLN